MRERQQRTADAGPKQPQWESFEDFCLQCRTRQRDGIKGLQLYDWQRRCFKLLQEHGTITIAKSRQVGGSQAFILYALWRCLTQPGFLGLIASKKTEDARQLARRVRRSLRDLPTDVKLINDSLSQFVFTNDSQLLFRSSSPADGLSRSIDTLDMALNDEYSFWMDGQEAALGSLGPAMANSAHPEMIIVSTPNGKLDDYYARLTAPTGPAEFEQILEQVRRGEIEPYQEIVTDAAPPVVIAHWRCVPQYRDDPNFKQRMTKQLGLTEEKWRREFELDFQESEQTVFDFALVKSAAENYSSPEFQPSGIYYAGVDPAGIGDDYTVMVILEKRGNQYIVADTYRRRTGTSEMHMGIISDRLKKFQPIQTVIESNSLGQLYVERISSVCRDLRIDGAATTRQSKANMVGRITLALERSELLIPSGSLEHELLSFRRIGERMEAASGSHDDTVIALGLALGAANYGIQETNQWTQ